jgi:hypothetical protein
MLDELCRGSLHLKSTHISPLEQSTSETHSRQIPFAQRPPPHCCDVLHDCTDELDERHKSGLSAQKTSRGRDESPALAEAGYTEEDEHSEGFSTHGLPPERELEPPERADELDPDRGATTEDEELVLAVDELDAPDAGGPPADEDDDELREEPGTYSASLHNVTHSRNCVAGTGH